MDLRRELPSVDALARQLDAGELGEAVSVWLARDVIEKARAAIEQGLAVPDVSAQAKARMSALRLSAPKRVINATGVLLHTNLGRAPLHSEAVTAAGLAACATPVELDLSSGSRGGRGARVVAMACALTGAEDGVVVNNNAAALLLCLAAMSPRREVIVSRGELIEIGGSFRLPDVMAASGALLHEVGTTNRTKLSDYERALGPRTGAVLKIHPSNYKIEGFTEEVSTVQLAAIARGASVPLIYDVGSGLLEADERLASEPDLTSALRDGADLVCASTDKLLGGPQGGLILGRADLVRVIGKHPLARALRVGKLALAALDATLLAYVSGKQSSLPIRQMIYADLGGLRQRAEMIAEGQAKVVESSSTLGGGSAPGQELPTYVVAIEKNAESVAAALLEASTPIVGRVSSGTLLLDPRTIDPKDDQYVREVLLGAVIASERRVSG